MIKGEIGLKLGQVRSKTRSLGKIIEKGGKLHFLLNRAWNSEGELLGWVKCPVSVVVFELLTL